MRLTRSLVASFVAIVLMTAGTAGIAGAHDADSGGMSPQEMKCMEQSYRKAHANTCAAAAGHMHMKKVKLAKPLHYTKAGLIDVNNIDLSGVKGVTKRQQKVAEQLLVSTIKVLPKWSDPATAVADGFQSIGDRRTGEEHFLHWDWIDDNDMFDPEHPESLVYKVDRKTGAKRLEAAMYILPKQYTLDTPPEKYASNLVQFHEHENLCFSPPPASQVRGLTNADGTCGKLFGQQLVHFNPNIQVHVWIRANPCGPFAALLGVGAGQIEAGQQRACDHAHGRLSL